MRLWQALCIALVLVGCERGASTTPPARRARVTCVAANVGPWVDRILLRGLVVAAPDKRALVAAQVPGRITKLLAREGDALAQGAAIAEIERQPLDDALVQAEALVAQADAAVKNAELARRRAEHLVETGVAARQQLDDAIARHDTAVSAAAAARAGLSVSRRSVSRTTVHSPIAGVMLHVLRGTGELVDGTPATPVAEVADPKALELSASSGAADIARLSRGQQAIVRFDVLGIDRLPGEVRAVAPSVDPITGLGVVRVALSPGGAAVPLGVFGEASVAVATRDETLTIPPGALRTGLDGRPEALVCDGDVVRVRALEVGTRAKEAVEVIHGIAAGERVVADAAIGLGDGARVEVSP